MVTASAGRPIGGAGLADRGHAGADRQLAGDEVRAAGRAARLGVVVGEQHALGGDLVEVRRPARHHAAVVGADVPDADVVTHDDDDVGLLLRCSGGDEPHQCQQHRAQPYDMLTQESWFAFHSSSFPYHCSSLGQPYLQRDRLPGVLSRLVFACATLPPLSWLVHGFRHRAPQFSSGGMALSRPTSSSRTPPQSAAAGPPGNSSPRAGHAVAHSAACTCSRGSRGRAAQRAPAAPRRHGWLRPWRRGSAGIEIHRLHLAAGIDIPDVEDVAAVGPEPAAAQRPKARGGRDGGRRRLAPQARSGTAGANPCLPARRLAAGRRRRRSPPPARPSR